MTSAEVAVWSGCVGVFTACFVAALVNAAVTRSIAGLHAAVFTAVAGGFVLICSGLLLKLAPSLPVAIVRSMVLLAGPLAAAVATWGLIEFLRAHQRDAIVQYGLALVCAAAILSLLSIFWPDYTQALEVVALTVIACSAISFWLVLRASLLGDRFAWPMAGACLAMMVAVIVLYGVSLGIAENNLALQALGAAAATAYIVGCAVAVWLRNTEYLRMRRALSMHREKDLLTQLWTGAALVKRVDDTIARARRNRKETALICIEFFNAVQLRQELGHNAVEQVIYNIAARVRQSVGSSTQVGRYDDTSFVVIVDAVKQPSILRTIGMRLATAVCRPYMLNPLSTSPREFRAEMGVGIARLPATGNTKNFKQGKHTTRGHSSDTNFGTDSMGAAQEAMHEASALAKAACSFASRVGIVDAYSRKMVALEDAQLR